MLLFTRNTGFSRRSFSYKAPDSLSSTKYSTHITNIKLYLNLFDKSFVETLNIKLIQSA